MTLNVISLCTSSTIDDLLDGAPCAKAQSDFLDLEWLQTASNLDISEFLDELQNSINSSTITLVLDGSEGFYAKALIAEALDLNLEENSEARSAVEAYAKAHGLSMGGRPAEGARLPVGSVPMCSKNCIDQGFIIIRGGRCIAVMPANKNAFDTMFRFGFYPFLLRNGAETAVVQTTAIRPSMVNDVKEYLRIFRHGKGVLPLVYEEDGQHYISITAIRESESKSRQACESLMENIEAEMGAFVLTAASAKKDARAAKKQQKLQNRNFMDEAEDYDHPALQAAQNYYEEGAKDKKALKKAKKQAKKQSGGFGFIRKFLLFVCICTFLGSSGYLGLRYYRSKVNIQDYNTLREVYESGGFPAMGYPLDYDNDFSGLYQINKDIAGWLSIEGTSLDYPVVQYSDNDYYHRLSFEGDYSLYGVPYVDAHVDLKAPSTNTILYGHNIKNDDQMFNSLIHYWDPSYFINNPVIDFHTVYGKREYKIFAAFVANVNPEHGEVFQYHTFVDADNVSDIQEFIYNVKVRSILDTGVDVLPSDELLTLSTCTYEFDNARFVVVARKLRPGESREIDASLVKKASAPLMPDIWYQLYGGSKPVLQTPSFDEVLVLDNKPAENPVMIPEKEPEPELPKEETVVPDEKAEASVPAVTTPAAGAAATTPPPAAATPPAQAPVTQTPPPAETTPPAEQAPAETPPAENETATQTPAETPAEKPEAPKQEEPVKNNTSSIKDEEKEEPKEEVKEEAEPEPEKEPEPDEDEEDEDENYYDADEELSVKMNGSKVKDSAYDIVAMMVQAEMGSSFEQEALKAQAVAAYTFVKYNNAQGISPSVVGKTSISSNVAKAVKAVIGEAVYYNGSYANTVYCAANAGVSNNCVDVWGGNLPYLVSVESKGDKKTQHYGYETKLSLDYVAQRIESYHSVDPYDYSSDPEDWFGSYSNGAGLYVDSIKVCGSKLTGRKVREGLLQSKIRSAAFEVEYDSSNEVFIFTTFGYGHGVGMSQLGANYYAQQGWSYDEILEHYYSGARVK